MSFSCLKAFLDWLTHGGGGGGGGAYIRMYNIIFIVPVNYTMNEKNYKNTVCV